MVLGCRAAKRGGSCLRCTSSSLLAPHSACLPRSRRVLVLLLQTLFRPIKSGSWVQLRAQPRLGLSHSPQPPAEHPSSPGRPSQGPGLPAQGPGDTRASRAAPPATSPLLHEGAREAGRAQSDPRTGHACALPPGPSDSFPSQGFLPGTCTGNASLLCLLAPRKLARRPKTPWATQHFPGGNGSRLGPARIPCPAISS